MESEDNVKLRGSVSLTRTEEGFSRCCEAYGCWGVFRHPAEAPLPTEATPQLWLSLVLRLCGRMSSAPAPNAGLETHEP